MRKAGRVAAPEPAAFAFLWRLYILPAVFLLFGCFFVWFRIEPALEYQRGAPVFFLRHSFFAEFPGRPGGLAEYAAAFLAQLNFHNWLGALVFALLSCAAWLLLEFSLRRITGSRTHVIALGIPFLLLIARGLYSPNCLVLAIGLILAFGFCLAATLLAASRLALRILACWFLGVLVFYLAGFWPLAEFALLCGLQESLRRKSRAGALACFGSIAAGPVWLLMSPDLEAGAVFNPWGKGSRFTLAVAIYGFAPVLAAVLGIWGRASPAPQKRAATKPASHFRKSGWIEAALVVAAMVVAWVMFDAKAKALAQIEYFTANRQYEKIPGIAATVARKDLDAASEMRLQLALYHTGRLCEDLFSFRNQSTWNLLPGLSLGLGTCRPQSRVLLELGMVSDAEHYAHEALELEGDHPETLRLLASVNILKGRPRAARVFLGALSQVPFQGGWARRELRALTDDAPLEDKAELERVRSCMFTNDLAHESLPAEPLLRQLLCRNENNRMAFEYLMAHYLIHLQTDKIVEALPALDTFGYRQIPRHLEEAVLLHQKLRNTTIDLHGRAVRPETTRRFEQFSASLQQGLDQTAEGRRELTRDFGDTFWYFYLARRSR